MSLRERLRDLSRGDDTRRFWKRFFRRDKMGPGPIRDLASFFLARTARRLGGYVGDGAVFEARPALPHGLHGIYISRYARIGAGCRIYQNVTIGEVRGRAPRIGRRCLIGAGAVVIGDITVGDDVKIGAGAVVCRDLPAGATAVAPQPRVLLS